MKAIESLDPQHLNSQNLVGRDLVFDKPRPITLSEEEYTKLKVACEIVRAQLVASAMTIDREEEPSEGESEYVAAEVETSVGGKEPIEEGTTQTKQKGARRPAYPWPNDREQDKWYYTRKKDRTYTEVEDAQRNLSSFKRDWKTLSASAIRVRITRYREHYHSNEPKNQGGRPTKTC